MAVAIIAEYNPFHNGHKYQLEKARERFPDDEIIIIMSGKYVQRGEIAVASFKQRKNMALKYGASQVFELPFQYATQAAHIFAQGAIEMVNHLGIKKLFFGSESNDPSQLMKIARSIHDHEQKYNQLLKHYLKQKGNSFPKSASLALHDLTNETITLPNDILGLEYCKAIVNNNYDIEVFSLQRTIDFHSKTPSDGFASASYIRQLIYNKQHYEQYSPMKIKQPVDRLENHYQEFQAIVRQLSVQELAKNKMISEGMENLFKKHIDALSMDEFINRTNSKRYTSSRIKRTILYVLLGINKIS